ncbi:MULTISPECIES: hypothetical protein [Rhodococcus erythropolis group]|mgnify:CR=1 FL=1|jgi:hypothetical protein|nr:hypothetical protein [uncultured Rhodococcus sp.]
MDAAGIVGADRQFPFDSRYSGSDGNCASVPLDDGDVVGCSAEVGVTH